MSFFGVQLNAQVNRLFHEIRLTLAKNSYLPNIRTIYRSCARFDPQHQGLITPIQFQKALNENGIFFKKFEWQAFEKAFTHPGQKSINWLIFLAYLRQPLNLSRTKVLDAIWSSLDSKNTGRIHYQQLSERFNAGEFKQFKLGFKTKDVILKELIGLANLTSEGFITYDQFFNFYTDMSPNIPSDELFSRFVSLQWGLEYKVTPVTAVEEVKSALRTIRFKLLQGTGGTHEEFVLRKIFNEFDSDKRGKLDSENLATMLVKLQIPTQPRMLAGIIARISHSNDGLFDFQDFQQFVFYDPYHI